MVGAPLRQGDLDGLCGIYSVVNGLNFLFSIRPAPGFSEHMFQTVARAIPKSFYPDVLWDGMDIDLLERVARRAAGTIRREIGFDIEVARPFARRRLTSRQQFLDEAADLMQARYSILILFVDWAKKDGGGSHWTVLRHIAKDHLGLVDSGRQRRLPLARLGLGEGPGTRILPRFTLMLTLAAIGDEKVS